MKNTVIAIFCFFSLPALLFAQIMDKWAATVNLIEPSIVTVKQFTATADQLKQQYASMRLEIPSNEEILEQMLVELLLKQHIKKTEGLDVTESDLFNALRSQPGSGLGNMSDEKIKAAVQKETGISWDVYVQQGIAQLEQIKIQEWVKQKKSKYFADLNNPSNQPSEADVQLFYKKNKTAFFWSDMVRATQLYIDTRQMSTTERQAKLQEIEKYYRDIQNGISTFDETVIKFTDLHDPRYKTEDGLIAFDHPTLSNLLGDDYLNKVFSLRIGVVSDVIASNIGYHIVRVSKKIERKFLNIDDPIEPDGAATVRQYIERILVIKDLQDKYKKATQELMKELKLDEKAEIVIYKNNLDISESRLKLFRDKIKR
ncbi:MAG: peptidylprolyl isomerase [Spirochaetota bacterium]